MEAPKSAPGPVANSEPQLQLPLPPKTPDRQEKKFLDRPDYKSADVKAAVAPSPTAPALLGLGARNRLGPFKIDNGTITLTGGAA